EESEAKVVDPCEQRVQLGQIPDGPGDRGLGVAGGEGQPFEPVGPASVENAPESDHVAGRPLWFVHALDRTDGGRRSTSRQSGRRGGIFSTSLAKEVELRRSLSAGQTELGRERRPGAHLVTAGQFEGVLDIVRRHVCPINTASSSRRLFASPRLKAKGDAS